MEDKLITVKDNRSYKKNPVRGTVVNADSHAYNARRTKIMAERNKDKRLSDLEEDVTEIKNMLRQLLDKA
jgi:hypothetical protein